MKKYLSLLLLLTMPAFAGDVTILWDAPTTNTDGSALTNLDGYFIKFGTTSGVHPNVIDVTDETVTQWNVTGLAPGPYYFVTTSYNTEGTESTSTSNEVMYTVPELVPNPPSNLVVQELVAYAMSISDNVVVLLPVGTVPPNTSCNGDITVNGRYQVDIEEVDWYSPSYRAPVVFASCG